MKEEMVKVLVTRRFPDINVTPLIDVLLVLLIIFMVITPLKPSRLESRIPESPASHPPSVVSAAPMVTLGIDHLGRVSAIQLNGQVVTLDQLTSKLRTRLGQRPPEQKTVFVQAPRHAIYGEVVRIIDRVKDTGASPIGLQIDSLPAR